MGKHNLKFGGTVRWEVLFPGTPQRRLKISFYKTYLTRVTVFLGEEIVAEMLSDLRAQPIPEPEPKSQEASQ